MLLMYLIPQRTFPSSLVPISISLTKKKFCASEIFIFCPRLSGAPGFINHKIDSSFLLNSTWKTLFKNVCHVHIALMIFLKKVFQVHFRYWCCHSSNDVLEMALFQKLVPLSSYFPKTFVRCILNKNVWWAQTFSIQFKTFFVFIHFKYFYFDI